MNRFSLLFVLFVASVGYTQGEYPQDSTSSYYIQLSPEACTVTPTIESRYTEEVDEENGVRIITANGIPDHQTGTFPNEGNPNSIRPQNYRYEIPLNPVRNSSMTSSEGKRFGILFSGVELDPFTGEFFVGAQGVNRNWNLTTLTNSVNLGLDCNNAHVQPNGKYHYHGTPSAFLDQLNFDGTQMIKLGYAADGFPIYYKFGYNDSGELKELVSGYRLKKGERPGDGKTAPNGPYDGTYFQDYEYVEGVSPLDECNGMVGKTPESEEEYYYLITDNFPSSPICFAGTPSKDFNLGLEGQGPGNGVRPGRDRVQRRDRFNDRPTVEELMQRMDSNHDGKIAKHEAKGPIQEIFDQIDSNRDGFLSKMELESHHGVK